MRDFVEERLEGLLDVPVEFSRAARASARDDLAAVAELATWLASQELSTVHEVYGRASRIVGTAADEKAVDDALLSDEAERELVAAVAGQPGADASHDDVLAWATSLAPVVERFFTNVLVIGGGRALRANRLRILRDVKRAIGRLGDLAEIPCLDRPRECAGTRGRRGDRRR